MSFPDAAAQFFDTGLRITLAAALLVSTAAFVVMRLYVRSVFRESQRSGSLPRRDSPARRGTHAELGSIGPLEIRVEKPGRSGAHPRPQSPTFQHADAAFRRAAAFCALAGSVHAATSVGLLVLFGTYSLPSTSSRLTTAVCVAAIFWSWSFITLVTLCMFFGPDRRLRGFLILGYAGVLLAMGALLEVAGAPALDFTAVGLMPKEEAELLLAFASTVTGLPVTAAAVTFSPHTQPIVFWSLGAAPVGIPIVAFNRFVRGTVGPLFINVALLMVLSSFLLVDIALTVALPWVARVKHIFGDSTYPVLLGSSLVVAAAAAVLGLRWIARRYRSMRLSDQTFLFDALWLSTSFMASVYLMGVDQPFRYLLGFLPFVLYKITMRYGLGPLASRARTLRKSRLLFLRVFGGSRRSEQLFDVLAARWRYAGNIQLISATDLARSRFEPDEFLDFLSGRLPSAYIRTASDLDARLAEIDLPPDPDGRFRVNEYFCHADTWQPTVTKLMARSDLIAMDLRAFTAARAGSIFELGALIDDVPLDRVVLLIDRTTDERLLRQTLADLWEKMNPRSPNAHPGPAHIRVIDLGCGFPAAVRRLMQVGDDVAIRDRAAPRSMV